MGLILQGLAFSALYQLSVTTVIYSFGSKLFLFLFGCGWFCKNKLRTTKGCIGQLFELPPLTLSYASGSSHINNVYI